MKQTFVVDIECEGENFESIYNDGILKWAKIQNCQLKQINSCTLTNFRVLPSVEQTVERPILQDESEKPLRLSGNIAWENRTEDGEDYLEDRFNDLLDR